MPAEAELALARMRRALERYWRGLDRGDLPLRAAEHGSARSFADARGIWLPTRYPMYGGPLARAAVFGSGAPLLAHARFGGPRHARASLKPIQIVLVSLF